MDDASLVDRIESSLDAQLGASSIGLRKRLILLLTGGIVFLGLFVLQGENYLLFHSLAELFSIVIASAVFLVAWNSRKRIADNFFIVIGVAYLSIAALDLFHTLAYAGMGVFPDHGADLPTQLWIGARYVEALSLVAGAAFIASPTLNARFSFGQNRTDAGLLFSVYLAGTALILGPYSTGCFRPPISKESG